jgi:hypothetical protein
MAERPREPRRTWLRRLLERPEARPRVRRAVGSLLGVTLVSIAALGILMIWHVVRHGRMIRERLGNPRDVRLPNLLSDSDREPLR